MTVTVWQMVALLAVGLCQYVSSLACDPDDEDPECEDGEVAGWVNGTRVSYMHAYSHAFMHICRCMCLYITHRPTWTHGNKDFFH